MWKGKRVNSNEQQDQEPLGKQQQYDTAVKAMLKEDAPLIIPLLVPGTDFLETLDIEVLRSSLRMDRAYRVIYEEELHLLQVEFQAGVDKKIIRRLLAYHTS